MDWLANRQGDSARLKRGKWSVTWSISAAGAVLLALHQLYISRAHPDAVYMDSLRLLHQLYDLQQGSISIYEVWAAPGHRGLITQVFLAVNALFLGLDPLLANRATGAVILGVGALIALQYYSDCRRAPSGLAPVNVLLGVLFLALGFSLVGFEVLTLDLGLPLWVKNLTFLSYWFLHARHLDDPRTPRAIVLSVVGPLIVLLVGMGWSYAFVGAVVLVTFMDALRTHGSKALIKAAPAILLVAALALYTIGGGAHDERAAVGGSGLAYKVLVLPLYSIASTVLSAEFVGREGMAAGLVLSVGAFLTVGAIAGLVSYSSSSGTGRRALYLISYGALSAAAFGLSRGDLGVPAVMASRYYMDLVLFPIGALWLLSLNWRGQERYDLFKRSLVFGTSVLLVTAHVYQNWIEYRQVAPYRAAAFAAMNEALKSGAIDEESARLLQAPLSDAQRAVDVMRLKGLGVFRAQGRYECDGAIKFLGGWFAPEASGRWMGRNASVDLSQCTCGLNLTAYIPPEFPERDVIIESDEGVIRRFTLRPGSPEIVRVADVGAGRRLRITVSDVTIPRQVLPGATDIRELGANWRLVGTSCELHAPSRRSST